jgi:drug/metabolite transporter (DMT)-like permease
VSSISRRQAIFFLVLAAVLWSSSGLLIKVIEWHPVSIFSARSMIASLVFWVYLRRFSPQWSRLQIAGAVSYVGVQLLFITATKLTTAANAIFLQYTSPVYVALLGYWLLHERPKRADWIAMPVIFVGLLLFFGDNLSLKGLYGNLLGVLSGVSMALMMLCMRGQKSGAPAYTILLGNILSALIGLPFLLQETLTLPYVGLMLYLGVFQIGLSFLLYSIAIKHVQALEATLILTLEPILNPLWVFMGLGEIPGQLAIAGGLVVLAAITFRAVSSANASPNKAAQPDQIEEAAPFT